MFFNSKNQINMKKIYFVLLLFLFSSCASIILPRRQTITFNTENSQSVVFFNDEKIGEGEAFKKKIRRYYTHQIVVQTPKYKDTYHCLYPTKRPSGFWPLRIMSFVTVYGIWLDGITGNTAVYPRSINIEPKGKYINKTEKDKYIDLESITVDIKSINKDITFHTIYVDNNNLIETIESTLDKRNIKEQKKLEEQAGKKSKKEKEYLKKDVNEIKIDNTIFSVAIKNDLKKTGFIDTVNKVFIDNNNTLLLQGVITKFTLLNLNNKIGLPNCGFYKTKVWLTWYMKNYYGEIIDSIKTISYSGDYKNYDLIELLSDAIETSALDLHNNQVFKKHLKYEEKRDNPVKKISIKNTKYLTEANDAFDASVIVKVKDGHGSGFAIGNDGYIITNFHVIAGKVYDKFDTVNVILSNGDKVLAKIIQCNRNQDIALLKIDRKFDKVFKLQDVKTYKNMQDVMTIGAPKSIELGQSIATGIISNERKVNNNDLIQLNMSVNSGNSGGPLFDKNTQLHGVIVSKLSGFSTEGICFAIPGYKIKSYLNLEIK